MASETGYNIDVEGFGQENIPPDLRSKDLPSERLLGKGLASIGYETKWKGMQYARKDFVGVPRDIFRNEADVLVRLTDHENVVKTHGLTVDRLSCSLVLEYMDDKLSTLLQKRKDHRRRIATGTNCGNQSEPFELQEALHLMLQIAKGMEHLHDQGILHGDLKIRNILVTHKDNGDKNLSVESVKVADFGLIQTKANSMCYASRQARKLDMVRWKAPENLKLLLSEALSSESDSNSDEEYAGSSGVTRSGDVYSFAMICFQILTGEEPYLKRNWKDLVPSIVSGELRPKLPPSCPPMLRDLLEICWATDPYQRRPFSYIREKLEHMYTLRKWIVKEEGEQKREQLEKAYNSLELVALMKPNFPISEPFEPNSSNMAHLVPDPDVLRKGKALESGYIQPIESTPRALTRTEELEISKEIQTDSRPDDAGPSANFRDDFDVFLSYSGSDIQAGFIAQLHDALRSVKSKDKKSLVTGDPAFRSIDDALEAAIIHVVVVSRGYIKSNYCLTELVAMMRSGKPLIPVFYDIEPAELRSVANSELAAVLEKHMTGETAEQVLEWVGALQKLADISKFCFRLSTYKGDETVLKQEVMDAILRLMPAFNAFQDEPHLVGVEEHVNSCVNKMETMSGAPGLLCLVGAGGIGKTLLAKEIYNHFVGHTKFQAMSFVRIDRNLCLTKDVEPSLLIKLQTQILWDLLNVSETAEENYQYHWFNKLSSKGPVLIVLDDIRDKTQFDKLIPDTSLLASGSCIIATSRDGHLLKVVAGESNFCLHQVTPLGSDDSQKLFNLYAFHSEESPENFKDLANDVSAACEGVPLALKVVGSSLFEKTTLEDKETIWQDAIASLRGNHDVMSALRWSYKCLSDQERIMFLDIASVFNGRTKQHALEIWKSCEEWSSKATPHVSLSHLIDKSLVTFKHSSEGDMLAMHGLLQDMGVHIAKTNGSYLSGREDLVGANKKVQGLHKVRALNLASSSKRKYELKDFPVMENLHYLILDGCDVSGNLTNISKELRWLQWRNMPMSNLPPMQNLFNLVSLDFSKSTNLATVWAESNPSLTDSPNLLSLNLSDCTSLTTLPDSIGQLRRLKVLELQGCKQLQELPNSIGQLTALHDLHLQRCESLEALPDSITELLGLQCLRMEGCSNISYLPTRIGLMTGLTSLSIDLATEWQAVGVGQLYALKHLTVMQCTDEVIAMVDSSRILENLNQLVQLHFFKCRFITRIPESIELLTNLEYLQLYHCEKLQDLPDSIGQLKALWTLDVRECNSLETLPDSLGALTSLRYLFILQCTSITQLPTSIGHLSSLWGLTIEGCSKLQFLPVSISHLDALRVLQILDCGSLEGLGALRALQGLRIWGCTSITELPGSCLIVLDRNFWDPAWYYDVQDSILVRRNLKELREVEANDCGFLRQVQDTQTGRLILQRVHKLSCSFLKRGEWVEI